MKNLFCIMILILTLLNLFCSITDNDTSDDNNNNTIDTSNTTVVGTQSISSTGGVMTILSTGSPVNGMTITVPSGSFSSSITLKVTTATINNHLFGANFTPISPMIIITADTGYADQIIIMKIPVKIPKGSFGMGFLYDPETKKLEGLPVHGQDSTSITVATRTFMPSSEQAIHSYHTADDLSALSIIISAIDTALLYSYGTIETGYLPRTDDWEFVNFGSYIATGGHCAGQSITSMWYYFEKKLKGAPSLYHHYDTLNDPANKYFAWYDNPCGFKFASTVQRDIDWDGKLYKLFEKIEQDSAAQGLQSLSWKAFAYTMLINKEPQFVGLTSDSGGHAIVAYKIDLTQRLLYVADPNYPGEIKTIAFNPALAKFDPYKTKQSANDSLDHGYWGIGYYAKTSMIDWNKISNRWTEFENKTTGNDRFPACTLRVFDGSGTYDIDTMLNTDADTVSIAAIAKCEAGMPGHPNHQFLQVYNETGVFVSQSDTGSGRTKLTLTAGSTRYGFLTYGGRLIKGWRFLDFRWVTIVNAKLTLTPLNLQGHADTTYTYTATALQPPNVALYRWIVTDSLNAIVATEIKTNITTFTMNWSKPGTYSITVKLFDTDTTKLVATTKTKAFISVIGGDPVPFSGSWACYDTGIGWAKWISNFSCSGSITGHGTTKIDSVYISLYGNLFAYYSIGNGDYTITVNASGTLSPSVQETTFVDFDSSKARFTVKGEPTWYISSSGLAPRIPYGTVGSSITYTSNPDSTPYGDIYMDAKYPVHYQEWDKNGTVIEDNDSTYYLIPNIKVHIEYEKKDKKGPQHITEKKGVLQRFLTHFRQ